MAKHFCLGPQSKGLHPSGGMMQPERSIMWSWVVYFPVPNSEVDILTI